MLSKNDIEKAIAGASGVRWITDSSEGYGRGSLVLKVTKGAKGTTAGWYVVWTPARKIQRHRLGSYPAMSAKQARDAYRDFDLSAPGAERALVGGTVLQLFEAYLATLQERGARSVDQLRRILITGQNAVVKRWPADRQAGEVTPGDVALILQEIHTDGKKRQADATRTAIAAAFNWGIASRYDYTDSRARDWQIAVSPVAAIKKDRSSKKARDRHLSVPEMRAVWNYENAIAGDVLRLILCCGQRVLETLRIEGSEVNLQERTWTMPAHKTKGGAYSHTVPLPAQAVEILARLKEQHGDGYLFPARGAKDCPHISLTSVNRATTRVPGTEPFQARDLRRTWKTRTGDAGIEIVIRDRIQQHVMTTTSNKFYDRYDYLKEKREGMALWEKFLNNNVVND